MPSEQVASYINTFFANIGNELFLKFSKDQAVPPTLFDPGLGSDQHNQFTDVPAETVLIACERDKCPQVIWYSGRK